MNTPDEQHDIERTERLLDELARGHHLAARRDGMTWDDVALLASEMPLEDGLTWDDATLAALALSAEAATPVPADVARRHLTAMHAAAAATAPSVSPRRLAWRRRVASAAAAATAFTTMGGGAAVAVAQEAAPGDALYGVKRASEQVRLVIERSEQGDAALHLEFAQRRLAETEDAPGEAPELLEDAFEHLAVAEEDGDAETVEAAKAAGANAIEVLQGLLDGGLPETASPRAREALERNLERKRAHAEAKESGAKGKDQAPGQNRDGDAPGRSGEAPGQSRNEAGDPEGPGNGQGKDKDKGSRDR